MFFVACVETKGLARKRRAERRDGIEGSATPRLRASAWCHKYVHLPCVGCVSIGVACAGPTHGSAVRIPRRVSKSRAKGSKRYVTRGWSFL